MPNIEQHKNDISDAIADRDSTRDDLFRQLMKMEPEERAKLSPRLFARLTQKQLLSLIGGKPSEAASISPATPGPSPTIGRSSSKKLKVTSPFRSACKNGAVVAAAGGAIVILSFAFGPYVLAAFTQPPKLSVDASRWPSCQRLDAHTDGCVYSVQVGLTWADAASILQMPETSLRAVNPSIKVPSAGTPIIVWRGQGTLFQ